MGASKEFKKLANCLITSHNPHNKEIDNHNFVYWKFNKRNGKDKSNLCYRNRNGPSSIVTNDKYEGKS